MGANPIISTKHEASNLLRPEVPVPGPVPPPRDKGLDIWKRARKRSDVTRGLKIFLGSVTI